MPDISLLHFTPAGLPHRTEFSAATVGNGSSCLVIRLDSPDPSDPFVFIREEGGADREQVPLSTLLTQLVPDERYVPAQKS